MSNRVEELRHEHGLLNRPKKPPEIEGETRPRYFWRLLRNSIQNTVQNVKESDVTDLTVSHGIQYIRKLNHEDPICQVVYNSKRKEYLSVDSNYIRVFQTDGRKKDMIIPDEPLDCLIYASHVNLFISWLHMDDQIYLLSNDYEIISDSRAPSKIECCVYNKNYGELVSTGPGTFTVWGFRYGARHLMPRLSTTEGLSSNDHFEILVLEDTAGQFQKCYAVDGTGVAVFSTQECRLLSYHRDLHTRPISAAMFFNPLKYLITGAKDGSIKIWDETFHLKLVFVGHSHKVSALSAYPYGPYFISASFDFTMRVWSLETCDEIDKVETDEPILDIGTVIRNDSFYTYSTYHMELWKIKHLHTEHSCIGFKVMGIMHTDHPGFPVRTVLLNNDSSVRIVAPTTGDILTTLIMPLRRKLIDAAYAIEEDKLFAVFANGDIVKSDTTTNPCTVLAEWPCKDKKKACNYLLVYEYVVQANEGDFWAGMKRAIQTQSVQTETQVKKANKTLLLGGRKDGYICVFNWETGEVDFETEAHGTKGVLSMVANSKYDQLISAGADNIIKVWRLYPFAQEALAPLLSFFCAHTPLRMTVLKTNLCVAFQEHSTATYNIVVHNLENKNRYDHSPEHDHTDSITGLACCQRLKLYASSSEDGTVKIWNEANKVIRVLKLNAVPHSLGFCSQKGDLLVGIGNHLHKIQHYSFLPQVYRFRLVCMKFNPVLIEEAIPFNEKLLNNLSSADAKRIKGAKSSFKFDHYGDILSEDELNAVEHGKREKDRMFMMLEQRDRELAMIRDGELQSKYKPQSTKQTKKEAFDKYLKIFYDRPKVSPIKDEYFYVGDELRDAMAGDKRKKVKDVYKKEQFTGFFPPPETAKKQEKKPDEPLKAQYPLRPDGFIPNSILARLLWPPEQKAAINKAYRPPMMNDKQMEQIKKMQKKSERAITKLSQREGTRGSSDMLESRTLVLDYGDTETSLKLPEEEEEEEDDDTVPEVHIRGTGKKVEKAAKDPSSYLQKLQTAFEKPATPTSEDEEEKPRPKTPSEAGMAAPTPTTKTISPVSAPSSARPKAARPPPQRKPIQKLIAKTPPKTADTIPQPPSPVRVRSRSSFRSPPRTPTPPPTPLPEFISQFKGVEWFEKYFPNCNEKTFPKPWSMSAFVTMLIRVVKISEYEHKVPITNALLMLHHQEGIPNNDAVAKSILGLLNNRVKAPSCLDEMEREFIRAALKLLVAMQAMEKELFMELMMQYLDGDKDVRADVQEIFHRFGIHDPHHYFFRELDSWDVWNLEETHRKEQLAKICEEWLDKWHTSFKIHLTDTIERLKKGQGVHGKVSKSPSQSISPAKSGRSILKATPDYSPDPLKPHSSASKSVTVTFDQPPDQATIDNATYLEAINYFVEMELERELDKMRHGRDRKPTADDGATKNTVLVFPKLPSKQCLVRLGETHTSQCRPHRETNLHVDYRHQAMTSRGLPPMPGSLHGFAPAMTLPMKTVNMNPFPSEIDLIYERIKANQPLLISLKIAPKYFIPAHSVVPPMHMAQEQY
ncbi:WD repeat-containing protein 97-like [Lineus longissimus]|uniref:WD repeat-containing protein 97-like n=1 Tax=Lineus longissimus TaxID=88925 RepID=UPI002B4EF2E8